MLILSFDSIKDTGNHQLFLCFRIIVYRDLASVYFQDSAEVGNL